MKTVELRVDVLSFENGIDVIPHTFLYVTDSDTGYEEGFGFAPVIKVSDSIDFITQGLQ